MRNIFLFFFFVLKSRYLFKKALLEDELANIERKNRQDAEPVVENEMPPEEPLIQMTQPKRTVAEDEVVAKAIAAPGNMSNCRNIN